MKDEFNHILNKYISEMPEHTPKQDMWQNIDAKLDEEIATTRLRKILKSNEHAPDKKLWKHIENELNRTSGRKPFYFKTSFYLLLSLFIMIGSLSTYFLLHNISKKSTIKELQNKNQILAYNLKSSQQIRSEKQALSSEKNKDNKVTNNSDNKEKQLVSKNNINKSIIKPLKNSVNPQKIISQQSHNVPSVTLENYISNKNESKKKLNDSNQTKIFIEKEEYSIYGDIKWNMIKSENVSLYVYNEDGKFVTSIFENRNFETGVQSYDFKVHNCHIDKDKKYIVRLIINNEIKEAMECIAK